MAKIPSLPADTPPLTGAELVITDDGTTTGRTTSRDLARLGALQSSAELNVFPERLDAAGTYFTTQGAGDPLAVWFPPSSIVAETGVGLVAVGTGSFALWTRGIKAASQSQVWEVEAVVEQFSVGAGETPTVNVGLSSLKSDYTFTSGAPSVFSPASAVLVAGNVVTVRCRFGAIAPFGGVAWADPTLAAMIRPFVIVNGSGAGSSVARIRRLTIRDISAVSNQADNGSTGPTTERFRTAAIVANVLTIDASGGNSWVVPLTSDITTFNLIGVPAAGLERGVKVIFVADGTARSIAGLNAVVKWLGLSNPTFTSTNTYENWCVFFMRDNNARVVGSFSGAAAP